MDLMITEHDNLELRGDGIKDSKDIAGTYAHTCLFGATTCSDSTMCPKRKRNSKNIEETNSDKSSTTDALTFPLAAAISSEKKEQVCKDGVLSDLERWHAYLRSYIPHRKIGTDGCGKLRFTSEQLKQITGDFSDKNFLGFTKFEMLYRGNLIDDDGEEFPVLVKICNLLADRTHSNIVWISRIIDEIKFLEDPTMKAHPNLVNLIGYCEEGKSIGVVYDLDPLDTLQNIILKGSLNVKQTLRIARTLAELIEFFHIKDYLLRNLTPSNIIIDKEFVPRYVDFMLLTGGIMGDRMGIERGDYNFRTKGYLAPEYRYSKEYDVYVYGVILISLIAKKCYYDNYPSAPFFADEWAVKEYNKPEVRSLVHESFMLEMDDDIGENITKLAMHCLEEEKEKRPTMKQVGVALLRIMACHFRERGGKRKPDNNASGRHF